MGTRTVAVKPSFARARDVVNAVRPLLERDVLVVVVLTAPGPVDVDLLDALARLALSARRTGCELRVHSESADLQHLAVLTGLSEALAFVTESGQAQRQAQSSEQLGTEEVMHVRDPSTRDLQDLQ